MSKRTMIVLLIVAAAAVGFVLWRRRQMQGTGGTVPVPTVHPTQVSPQAVVANAFSDLLNIGANSLAQWFKGRTGTPSPDATTLKPPPITSQGPSSKVPAASTPNLVTHPAPTYYA